MITMSWLFFQTVAIKEASLKCKQKQDQLDRKHKEVRLHFAFYSGRGRQPWPSKLIICNLCCVMYIYIYITSPLLDFEKKIIQKMLISFRVLEQSIKTFNPSHFLPMWSLQLNMPVIPLEHRQTQVAFLLLVYLKASLSTDAPWKQNSADK